MGAKYVIDNAYLADYLVCLLVGLNFFFASHTKFDAILSWRRSIKAPSSYTFTLYLMHGLVISAWNYFYGNRFSAFFNALLLTALVTAVTFVAGMLTEQRKTAFQKFFGWVLKSPSGSIFPERRDKRA